MTKAARERGGAKMRATIDAGDLFDVRDGIQDAAGAAAAAFGADEGAAREAVGAIFSAAVYAAADIETTGANGGGRRVREIKFIDKNGDFFAAFSFYKTRAGKAGATVRLFNSQSVKFASFEKLKKRFESFADCSIEPGTEGRGAMRISINYIPGGKK